MLGQYNVGVMCLWHCTSVKQQLKITQSYLDMYSDFERGIKNLKETKQIYLIRPPIKIAYQ